MQSIDHLIISCRPQNDHTIALSTTIVRSSPTPPLEPDSSRSDPDVHPQSKSSDPQLHSHQSRSLDPLPLACPRPCRSPERSGSALSCTRSHSECNFRGTDPGKNHHHLLPAGCGLHGAHYSEPGGPPLTKVDSGYASNLNIQMPAPSSQQWGPAVGPASAAATQGGPPPAYSSEELRYAPLSGYKPPGTGLVAGQPQHQHPGVQSLLLLATGRPLFGPQLAQQYLGPEGPPHPGAYHLGANGLYGDPAARHLQGLSSGPAGYHQHQHHQQHHPLHRAQHGQAELGMLGKAFGQHSMEPWVAGGLDEMRGRRGCTEAPGIYFCCLRFFFVLAKFAL